MATAAALGGIQYKADQEAAEASQAVVQPFVDRADQAQQLQMQLLGQGTPEEQAAAMSSIQNSPLVQMLNSANEEALQRRGIASGAGTGGILSALQQANQASLFQGAFGGLGSIAGQNTQFVTPAAGLAGQSAAAPYNAAMSGIGQTAQLAGYAAGGGFQMPNLGGGATPAPATTPTPSTPNFGNFQINPSQQIWI